MRNTLDDKRSADGFREALNSLSDREVSMLGFYLGSCVLLDREKGSCDNMIEIEALVGYVWWLLMQKGRIAGDE
jgi:hypothetical protein